MSHNISFATLYICDTMLYLQRTTPLVILIFWHTDFKKIKTRRRYRSGVVSVYVPHSLSVFQKKLNPYKYSLVHILFKTPLFGLRGFRPLSRPIWPPGQL